jgi:hypothetical protein
VVLDDAGTTKELSALDSLVELVDRIVFALSVVDRKK